ncbi:MAG: antibiotic biosynthesis monooxygenase (ABM) superfamily enzyme [Phenylobacterium sp.]|jgi:antibiotic biosynthesis monooxygenase (ABM) superfamily enzyme
MPNQNNEETIVWQLEEVTYMITYSLSHDIKCGKYNEAVAWAKERAAWVNDQPNCKEPVTVHIPVVGKQDSLVFVQAFDSLDEMHSFQQACEEDTTHQAKMSQGHEELFVEGSTESKLYKKVL